MSLKNIGGDTILISILGEVRTIRQKEHPSKEDSSWHNLYCPGNAKRRGALVDVASPPTAERSSILDKVLDQDTPCDRPLL